MTGSPSDSFSDEPWVVRLRQLLAAAVRRGQRVLGMCFGCQVVAVSLQGSAGELLTPGSRAESERSTMKMRMCCSGCSAPAFPLQGTGQDTAAERVLELAIAAY